MLAGRVIVGVGGMLLVWLLDAGQPAPTAAFSALTIGGLMLSIACIGGLRLGSQSTSAS